MAKNKLTISETLESHKPKNFKYRIIITDDSVWEELLEEAYDVKSLDTINDDELVASAINSTFTEYPREIVGKAKEPTILDDGIIVSKKMVTKADKKLKSVGISFFDHNKIRYVCIKLTYERFYIIEIFILT